LIALLTEGEENHCQKQRSGTKHLRPEVEEAQQGLPSRNRALQEGEQDSSLEENLEGKTISSPSRQDPSVFNKANVGEESEGEEEAEDEEDDTDLLDLAKSKKLNRDGDDEDDDGTISAYPRASLPPPRDTDYSTPSERISSKVSGKKPRGQALAAPPQKIIWTDELIAEKLEEIIKKRGMKKTAPKELLEQLKELLDNVKSSQKKVEIYMQMIAIMFDKTRCLSSSAFYAPLTVSFWRSPAPTSLRR